MNTGTVVKLSVAGAALTVGLASAGNIVEYLDAKHVMVIQYPNGTLQAFTEPGIYPQWFGSVTKYDRRKEFAFGKDKGHPELKVRFNDGGYAGMTGAVSWEMPTNHEHMIRLQKEFGSQEAIESQLVTRALNTAVYFTGPLMSSVESAGERRSELLQFIDDQARNGVYQMETRPEKQKDPVTGVEKTVNVVEIIKRNGVALRNSESAVSGFGIQLLPLAVSEIAYEQAVEKQIKDRQNAINQVQIAIANAKRAEQDALTIAKQGEATATKAKWEQETIKAREVTAAEQRMQVAKLDKDAAEFTKQREILLGQGEAERKKLVMNADGALTQKLEALVAINKEYATAIKDYKGDWVPKTVMGSSSGGNNGAMALVDLLTAKTARDLGIDTTVQKK